MKKIGKWIGNLGWFRKIIVVLLVGAGIFFGYRTFFQAKTVDIAQDNEIYTVSKMPFKKVIKVLGNTELDKEQHLNFLQSGKVKKIYVKEGDTIQAGQLLAEIDKKDILNEIQNNQLAVQTAKLNLSKLYSLTTKDKIITAQNNVDDTKRKIQVSQKELSGLLLERDTKLADIQTTISEAKANLGVTQQESTNTTTNQKDTTIESIIQIQNNISVALDDADKFLGASQKYKSQTANYENYIGGKNLSQKYQALDLYIKIFTDIQSIASTALQYKSQSQVTNDELLALLNATDKDLGLMKSFLDLCVQVLLNTLENPTFTQTTIDNNKTIINSDITKNSTDATAVKNLILTIQNLSNNFSSGISTNTELTLYKAQNAYDGAVRSASLTSDNYEKLIQAKHNEIDNFQSILSAYEAALQDLESGPLHEDQGIYENSVKQSQITLNKLQDQLNDYEMRSSFDGIVRTIDFKVGDSLTPSSPEYITVENPDIYNIVVQIDQIDIVKVKVGQPVEVVFDAYQDKVITGVINQIDSTPIDKSGVISYKAKIFMQKHDFVIYPSMTVNATILVDERPDVLAVPSLGITSSGTLQFVDLVLTDKTVSKKLIKVGDSDDGFAEVLTGLIEGDKIRIKNFDIQSQQTTSSFGPNTQNIQARDNLLKIRGENIPQN